MDLGLSGLGQNAEGVYLGKDQSSPACPPLLHQALTHSVEMNTEDFWRAFRTEPGTQ